MCSGQIYFHERLQHKCHWKWGGREETREYTLMPSGYVTLEEKKNNANSRPCQDSNLESPDSKSGALSIGPQGLPERSSIESLLRTNWEFMTNRSDINAGMWNVFPFHSKLTLQMKIFHTARQGLGRTLWVCYLPWWLQSTNNYSLVHSLTGGWGRG